MSISIRTDEGNVLALPQAIQYAIQLHQSGHLLKAIVIYQQVLQIQPHHVDALHLLGLAHHQLGKHDVAYTLINKAIALNPKTAHCHNNLGEICRALNRPDEALACYAKALSLQPKLPETHRNIGLTYLGTGQLELGVSCLRDALDLFPDYLGIYWALGLALTMLHKPYEAVSIYNLGLERSPADAALLCAKGIALRATGELEKTIQHYRQAIHLQPHVSELHHNLALVFKCQGNVEDAIACFENELKLNPTAESAQHLLAALQNVATERAPASYVRETFDRYADDFDQHLVDKLDYQTPKLIAEILHHQLGAELRACSVLDLGCGTGLFGEHIKDIKKQLVGIDLAPRMIDKARERGIYDQLIVGDLLEYLADAEVGQFDVIAATDVFNYVGNLMPVFEHVSRILAPGGWFTFSIEAAPDSAGDFVLDRTGRYLHHINYLEQLKTQHGFIQTSFLESCLRKEKGSPVEGYLYVLRKRVQITEQESQTLNLR